MNAEIKFYKGNKINLPSTGEPGAIYHCLDTKDTYLCLPDKTLSLFSTALTSLEMQEAVAEAVRIADQNQEFHGISATHEWDGTILTITSASGTSSANLQGDPGYSGLYVGSGEPTDKDYLWLDPEGIITSQNELKGPKGDPGDTYVLTDRDKSDIVEIVLNLIPKWTGGEF